MQHRTEQTRQPSERDEDLVSAAVRNLVQERGEAAAVEVLGIAHQTLARLYGGMPVRRATIYMAASRLGIALGRNTTPAAVREPEPEAGL